MVGDPISVLCLSLSKWNPPFIQRTRDDPNSQNNHPMHLHSKPSYTPAHSPDQSCHSISLVFPTLIYNLLSLKNPRATSPSSPNSTNPYSLSSPSPLSKPTTSYSHFLSTTKTIFSQMGQLLSQFELRVKKFEVLV